MTIDAIYFHALRIYSRRSAFAYCDRFGVNRNRYVANGCAAAV